MALTGEEKEQGAQVEWAPISAVLSVASVLSAVKFFPKEPCC